MIVISKISIEYYRSLKTVVIKNVNHLNIFSGKNDIGKSNVLKALDTFFNKIKINFIDDYNKERLSEVRKESIKGKQYIKITLELHNPGSYKTLPDKFLVSKSWDRQGNLIEGYKDNFEALIRRGKIKREKIKSARTALTKFLNRIRFTYVPAVRDEDFFLFLLNKLQETIFEAEERKRNQTFQRNISSFNKTIGDLTKALNSEFESVSGIASNLSFPNNISDIFQSLIIDTKSGEHDIPLRLRGDGIRLRYIPTILNYIANNSRYFEIWGFDEPENSCEYSLSKKISEQFASEYSTNTQIFVASHSFHFISLNNPTASKFRVYREKNSLNTDVVDLDDSNSALLSNELGILEINNELAKMYDSLTKEMEHINETKSALVAAQKPYLIFEGKTDNELFELAYGRLFKRKIESDFILCEHLTIDNGSSIGSGARFVNEFLYNHITKLPTNNKVIGIFDFDRMGVEQITPLKRTFKKIDDASDNFILYQHKTKPNVFAMTIVTPSHRSQFTHKTMPEYCYLSSELLFQDGAIAADNRQHPTLFDETVFSFKGDKSAFVERIKADKNNIDFVGFKPTFDLIQSLVSIPLSTTIL